MTSENRIRFALSLVLGWSVALVGCSSSNGGGGTGGAGGQGGAGGAPTGPLRILVTNDDGVGAPGIDAVVEALRVDPDNDIVVSAPAENRSGSGDMTSSPPLQATMTTTASGFPASAVDGFPADSVLYALENLYPDEPPHVVLSGINEGQNVGNVGGLLSQISGTVGAAKTAACSRVPALATSQGDGDVVDYPSGVMEVVAWVEDNRAALLAGEIELDDITSINIPSCDAGAIRGRLEVPLATENPNGILLTGPQDCESTVEDVPNDVEAFFNGYTTVTLVPSNSSNTCDKLNP